MNSTNREAASMTKQIKTGMTRKVRPGKISPQNEPTFTAVDAKS